MKKLLPSQLGRMLFEITHDRKGAELDRAIQMFVVFVRKQQMMKKMSYIVEAFVAYAKAQSGEREVAITTARKASPADIKKIAGHFGPKVTAKTDVREDIIGGAVVRDGNTVFDASVKRQLERLQQHLH